MFVDGFGKSSARAFFGKEGILNATKPKPKQVSVDHICPLLSAVVENLHPQALRPDSMIIIIIISISISMFNVIICYYQYN